MEKELAKAELQLDTAKNVQLPDKNTLHDWVAAAAKKHFEAKSRAAQGRSEET